MSMTSTLLHSSTLVQIRHVACRPHTAACGDVECVDHHSLVLPLAGVFLKHVGREERVVGDRQHVLFFRADGLYRISHPRGGDECLALDFSPDTLRGLGGPRNERAAECDPFFGAAGGRLGAASILLKHEFAARLRARRVTALEADERALELLAACAPLFQSNTGPHRRRGSEARQRERIEATLLTLSAQPGEIWTLPQLARRVHTSPWHLARQFRRSVGMPLHQFQLLARLASALDRVLDGAGELAPLAAELGFAGHSHFTASFRRLFGCTPTALRRSARVAGAARAQGRAAISAAPKRT